MKILNGIYLILIAGLGSPSCNTDESDPDPCLLEHHKWSVQGQVLVDGKPIDFNKGGDITVGINQDRSYVNFGIFQSVTGMNTVLRGSMIPLGSSNSTRWQEGSVYIHNWHCDALYGGHKQWFAARDSVFADSLANGDFSVYFSTVISDADTGNHCCYLDGDISNFELVVDLMFSQ